MLQLDQRDSLFWWARVPPSHWAAALRAQYPAHDNLEYPDLVWEPGTSERPVQRWAIIRSFPAWSFPEVVRKLEEENVRSPVRAQMRDYYASSGRVRWAWWLIQGTMGGNPVSYTEEDAAWFRYLEQPDRPPKPGAQCYAEFDARVLTQLRMYDLRDGRYVDPAVAEEARAKAKRILQRTTSWEDTEAMVSEDLRSVKPALMEGAHRVESGSARDYSRVDDAEIKERHIAQVTR